MGFIKEIYSNNHAGLVVAFGRGETSENYFNGDSIQEAMKHFNMYIKNNELYVKTEDTKALDNLGINSSEAIEFRSIIDTLLVNLSDEQASQSSILFPNWQPEVTYKVGERVRYKNKLYRVLQEHISQTSWEPVNAASLFAPILTEGETNNQEDQIINEWIQPDSTNPYLIGEQVIYAGAIYESLIDNNIWSPVDYPDGWNKISEI